MKTIYITSYNDKAWIKEAELLLYYGYKTYTILEDIENNKERLNKKCFMIDNSDIFLINLNNINEYPELYFEMFRAYHYNKPIIGVGNINNEIIDYIITKKLNNLEDAVEYIKLNYY